MKPWSKEEGSKRVQEGPEPFQQSVGSMDTYRAQLECIGKAPVHSIQTLGATLHVERTDHSTRIGLRTSTLTPKSSGCS